uniref:integrin alpha-M-like n=1 Tax=Myxine glutinosa TaxID=7769 RepID=UPI0035900785
MQIRDHIFGSSLGARSDAKKILVIITDGASDDSHLYSAVTKRADGMKVIRFAIGVGDAFNSGSSGRKELETMASKPVSDYVFSVTRFDFLSQLLKQLEEKIFAIEGVGDVETSFEMELASAGLSAHLSKDDLMLGAPGAYEWRGAVIHKTPRAMVVGKKTPMSLEDKDGYLGYSVTTVQRGRRKSVVSGAPRWQHQGRVFLFDIHATSGKITVNQRFTSFQLGSYFGAEVCDVDLDGDGNTDLLLVSAPLFHKQGDEGRVYIYTPQPNGSWMYRKILEGDSGEIWSRFGSALAELADLDGDGLREVAVGAPHEGDHSGAVYIFRGRPGELETTPIQRITSSTAGPSFKFFGRSLYGKLDQTGDELPDVAVGTQDSAVLLRSRPVVSIKATMTFTPEKIPLVEIRCSSTADANSNIIQMEICFETTAVNFRPSSKLISFTYVVDLESKRRTARATLAGGARRREEFLTDVPYKHCPTQQIMLNCKEKDVVNPIIITVDFFLPKKAHTPLPNPQLIMNYQLRQRIISKFNFERDCGVDNVCIPDLSITAQPTTDPLILGHDPVLSVNFTITNKGEDSFFTVLSLVYPSLFYFKESDDGIKCGIPEKDAAKELVTLMCDVNYPVFKKSTKFLFKVEFEVGVIKDSLPSIAIHAKVNSDDELPKTLMDNDVIAVARVLYAINTVLKGNVQSYKSLNRTEKNNQILWFYFQVDNQGQLVKNLSLEITIPCAFEGQNFLTFDTPQFSHPVSCETKQLEAPGKSQVAGPWDATNTASSHWKCHITSLKRRETAHVTLKGNLIVKTLTGLNVEKVKMKSEAHLRFDTSVFKQVSDKMAQYNNLILSTDFIYLEMTSYIPIMVGASVGGLLLLLIISAILYKVGFFKRNYKDKMAGEVGAANTDDVVSTIQSTVNLPEGGQ